MNSTSSTSAVSAASGQTATTSTGPAGAGPAPRATRENAHVAIRGGQDSQLPGPSRSGLGPIFRPSVPPYVPMATVPSTISNSFVGPNFGQIASPWMCGLMWNPLLAMAVAAPQQAQSPLSTSCTTYTPSSSSKGKGKRPMSPSEGMPASKKGRYLEADVSSGDSDMSEDEEELAEPFDPSSFYNNVSKQPLPDNTEKYIDLHFRSCLSGGSVSGVSRI